jgi:hypothetical protein
VDDGKAVLVLAAPLARELLAPAVNFRDRTLAKFADADRVKLERDRRKATFAREAGSWKLTEPLSAEADQDALDDLVNTLATLRADAIVKEKPGPEDLKAFGLDRPEARYVLQSGDNVEMDLAVGAREKDGPRAYARLAGKDLVFLLDAKLTAKLLGELRKRAVFEPPLTAADVGSLRFVSARNPFTLERAGADWHVAGMPEAKVDTAAVNDTLAALAKLKVAYYAIDKDADLKLYGLDAPELTLEATGPAGKRTLQIGAAVGATKQRYARVPAPGRSDVFVLDEADVAKLLRDVKAFVK